MDDGVERRAYPVKLCECGCGQPVRRRFLPGHNSCGKLREKCANWKGGKRKVHGYIVIYQPDHPDAVNGYVPEHRLILENYLGRYLERYDDKYSKYDEISHHIDEIKDHNIIENLELCSMFSHTAFHNLGNTNMRGKSMSEETKDKMSKSKTGVKRKPFSEEWKRKMSIAAIGNKNATRK